MLLVTCSCGMRMKVASTALGRSLTCTKCGEKRILTAENTLPVAGSENPGSPPTTMAKRRIGEMLIEAALISRPQLEEALKLQPERGAKIVDILISLGYLDHAAFVRFLAQQPGVASIDLSNYEIPAKLVALVPREFAVKHEVFPIDKLGRLLTLGMVCPLDAQTIHQLEELTSLRIKPLLCAPNDVREAIRRYYPEDMHDAPAPGKPVSEKSVQALKSPLKLEGVASLVRQVNSLPALPETVGRVRDAMANPLSSASEVGEIIAMDPALAAKVLSVANSAAYGFPSRVDDVTLAVTLLGLRETYAMVLSAVVINFFENARRFDYKAFWLDSTRCAAASRLIAKMSGRSRLTGVVTAGLLHDIGRAVLAEVAADRYAQVPQEGLALEILACEEQTLGFAHPEAGYELAVHWGLPAAIAECIRFHHHPERAVAEYQEIVAVVALASAMTYSGAQGDEGLSPWPFDGLEGALDTLALSREAAENILGEFIANYERSTTES